jgi:probable HAF family extracellular repeat protein
MRVPSLRSRQVSASVVLLVAVSALPTVSPSALAAAYTILDLGTLGGFGSSSAGYNTLNASGQVVGTSFLSGNVTNDAYRTAPNSAISPGNDLGNFGGNGSDARGINASGQAVGSSDTTGNTAKHAFRTSANGAINAASDLGTLGGTNSFGWGVNVLGQAVGYSDIAGNSTTHAFRTAPNGVITALGDLGTLGGSSSVAFGLNASGQTVGSAYTPGDAAFHGFRTTADGVITLASDLGTLGGTNAQAFAINDSGQVVGYSFLPNNVDFHAFRTTASGGVSAASDLGTLGGTADGYTSYAYAINSLGQVVGTSKTPTDPTRDTNHAFFADVTGPMQDLNDLIPAGTGWVLREAHGINDSGQIAGFGTAPNGEQHAFLLTPTPEPASLCLLALGCVGLLGRRRRADRNGQSHHTGRHQQSR